MKLYDELKSWKTILFNKIIIRMYSLSIFKIIDYSVDEYQPITT